MDIKDISKVAVITIIIFNIIGFILFNIIIHEIVHKIDLGGFAENEEVCFFKLGKENVGSYKADFSMDINSTELIKRSEIKAYGINILICFLYAFLILKRFKN